MVPTPYHSMSIVSQKAIFSLLCGSRAPARGWPAKYNEMNAMAAASSATTIVDDDIVMQTIESESKMATTKSSLDKACRVHPRDEKSNENEDDTQPALKYQRIENNAVDGNNRATVQQRPIVGFPEYTISSDGLVLNQKGKRVNLINRGTGVVLGFGDRRKSAPIRRLLIQTFPELFPFAEVHSRHDVHLDNDPKSTVQWRPVVGFPSYSISSDGLVVDSQGKRRNLINRGTGVPLQANRQQKSAPIRLLLVRTFPERFPSNRIWKAIDGSPTYEVSTDGHVWRGDLRRELKLFVDADGYTRVTLARRQFLVHRLVATAFLGPPPTPAHSTVNHKDRDKTNNDMVNLEYATRAEQSNHVNVTGRQPHADSRVVVEIDVDGKRVAEHSSIAEAARMLLPNVQFGTSTIRGRIKDGKPFTNGHTVAFRDPPKIRESRDALPEEEWKSIIGAPRSSEISSHGRVRNSTIIRKPFMSGGYPTIKLNVNQIPRIFSIHRLVAEYFLPKPPDDENLVVDHIDGSRTNNHYLNLRWVSRSQNTAFDRSFRSTQRPINKSRRSCRSQRQPT
jgi:hypothetical protein